MNASIPSPSSPAPPRRDVSLWLLTFGLVAAPLTWIVQTSLNYLVASRACYPYQTRYLDVVTNGFWPLLTTATFVALAIGIAAALTSWRAWRLAREEHQGGWHQAMEVGEGRTRFLALSGLMLSSLFVAAVIFNAVGLFVVPPCG
jgi:hypothetical protein